MSWRVVRVAFVVAMFGWGVGFYGPAVYLPTLHRMHGWPISTISAAVTAHYLVSAALIAGLPGAYRRLGVGRITVLGALLAGIGAIAWAEAARPWHLVPALLFSAAGWAATSGAALNAIVAPWFDRERPRAISMAFNGASVGGVVFVPLWTLLIATFDLPVAALILGSAMICIVCPLAWRFLRSEPPLVSRHRAVPLARTELLRQGRFITISLAFALGLFAQIGLFTHLPARIGPEFGPSLAAAAISLVTLCAVLGRTAMAWLLGERDRRVAAAANLALQAAGSSFLAFGEGVVALATGCVLFGLGVGNLTSLPPLIAQREFRPADVGTVVALVTAINQAVFAFAPAILGWLHDRTANYVAAFVLAGTAQVAAAAIVVAGRRFS